jgi:hypothetical protein
MMHIPLISLLLFSTPSPSDQPSGRKIGTFLGFSASEAISAWNVQIIEPVPETTHEDHYTLIYVVDNETNRILISFKGGPVVRKTLDGQKVSVENDVLLKAHPRYSKSYPQHEWAKAKSQLRLHTHTVNMTTDTIRILPDEGVSFASKVKDKMITFTGNPGQAVSFTVMARLVSGVFVPIGHFKSLPSEPEGTLYGKVVAYHSSTASHVAATAQFFTSPTAKKPFSAQGSALRTASDRFATNDIGTMKAIPIWSKRAQDIVLDLYPDVAGEYMMYVGED